MLWMKDIIRKFTILGDLIVEFCAGKITKAKACMI